MPVREADLVSSLVCELADLSEFIAVTASAARYADDVDMTGIEPAGACNNGCAAHCLNPHMALPLLDAAARAEPTGDDLTARTDRAQAVRKTAGHLGPPHAVHRRLREEVRVRQKRVGRQTLDDRLVGACSDRRAEEGRSGDSALELPDRLHLLN
ncbi:hypothetical protein [Winogradskya humida]|uniref:Uncharacterized protein n=1 Tax=Winogradskya humida TaxID=113566 RepID=A0ABQ4A1Z0_9ACTN|nr:hypothetical protein [Actinoplanes humidus]GIE24875.1 hypothetical protein Ahu01nite_079770 [Actinoplanes humidus]